MDMSKIDTVNVTEVSDVRGIEQGTLAMGAEAVAEKTANSTYLGQTLSTIGNFSANFTVNRNASPAEKAALNATALFIAKTSDIMVSAISTRDAGNDLEPKNDITVGGPLAPAKPKAKLTAPGLSFT